jgi:hypothetical protein
MRTRGKRNQNEDKRWSPLGEPYIVASPSHTSKHCTELGSPLDSSAGWSIRRHSNEASTCGKGASLLIGVLPSLARMDHCRVRGDRVIMRRREKRPAGIEQNLQEYNFTRARSMKSGGWCGFHVGAGAHLKIPRCGKNTTTEFLTKLSLQVLVSAV